MKQDLWQRRTANSEPGCEKGLSFHTVYRTITGTIESRYVKGTNHINPEVIRHSAMTTGVPDAGHGDMDCAQVRTNKAERCMGLLLELDDSTRLDRTGRHRTNNERSKAP